MKKNSFDIEEIKEKNAIIDRAIVTLKKEFVGIDKQIDEVMDNVRSWYLYPQLQTRPLVIAIWGLSGTGKTVLVRRISQLLDIEKDFVYWNFASISESSSWEIENQIEEELSNEKSNRMFVYDEFQYAATLNPKTGDERDNKSGLKPFWELLDTGLIHKRSDFYLVRTPFKILDYMTKINMKKRMEIVNGVWLNAQECLDGFRPYDIMKFHEVFNFETDTDDITSQKSYSSETTKRSKVLENYDEIVPFFIKEPYLAKIIELYDKSNGKISDKLDIYHRLEEMDCSEIMDFLVEVYENAKKGYNLNFSDSIIFVIGNLDEAYEMSFDVNPDMSPDQFRKITEKITVVDIKDALTHRFRNEQIARFGNIHIIYPSFSRKNFEDIIDISLKSYAKEVYKLTGYEIKFDDTIKSIIYEEGVFPTHGTRPVLSTIYEIVKSRLPKIMASICDNGIKDKVVSILYTFDSNINSIVVYCQDSKNNELLKTNFDNINLRLKSLRDSNGKDDEQALCALHESGHFVMYAKLFGKLPEKLVSRTTETGTGGFLMEDIDAAKKNISKKDMLNKIKVLLGGYVAEKEIFGEEMSAGAWEDLREATKLASKIVRKFGMGSLNYTSTYVKGNNEDPFGYILNEENQSSINREIKDIMNFSENEVRQTFINEEWRKMLKESSLYLCENSAMPKHKMQEIYDKVADSVKNKVRSNTFYRDRIVDM